MSEDVNNQQMNTGITLQQLASTVVKRRGRGFTDSRSPDSSLLQDNPLNTSQLPATLPSGEALPERSVEGWTVFLSGLHEEATEDSILDHLTDLLPTGMSIREVKVAMDHRTGYAKGYGVVECREYREARAVIEAVDGRPFMGVPMRADFAFIRSQ